MFRRRTSSPGKIHYRINIDKSMCPDFVDIYIDGDTYQHSFNGSSLDIYRNKKIEVIRIGGQISQKDQQYEYNVLLGITGGVSKGTLTYLYDSGVHCDLADTVLYGNRTTGVDLGIKTLATLSDGMTVENPHFLRENQAKLKRMQRHLSRKKLGSNRRNKCRLKVSRLHCDIANKRSWYMHNLTTMLVNNYDVICIEDLNVSGMLQNHKLASSVSDTSFSMFRNQLEYKCRWYGKELIVIDRFYPSSKTCSRCGWKNKDLKLSDRTFVCKDCGLEIDRDLNAAINIQAVGVDAAIRTQSSRVAGCVEASKME